MRALFTMLARSAPIALALLQGCSEKNPHRLGGPIHEEPALTSTTAIARARATHFGANGVRAGKKGAFAGGKSDRFFAAAVDASGRLVAVGASEKKSGGSRALIARFELDGTLDRDFGGGDGVVLGVNDGAQDAFDGASAGDDAFYGVRIDPLGRIVVAGKSSVATRSKALLARYLPGGAIDTTFGDVDGTGPARLGYVIGMGEEYLDDQFAGVRPESANPDECYHAIDLDAEGRILAAGVTSDLNKSWLADTAACKSWLPAWLCRSGFYTTLIARWTNDGRLDTAFNGVGYVTGSGGRGRWWIGRHDEFLDLRVTEGGRILAVGYVSGATMEDQRPLIAAYRPDGKLDDEGFGSAETRGFVLGPERARAGGSSEELYSLAIDAQGKLVVAGASLDANKNAKALVARYLPTGTLDPSFAEAGYILEDISGDLLTVRATLDERGMIVAHAPPKLLRYTSTGAPDESFQPPSVATATAGVTVRDLLIDRFSKIYLVGARGKSWLVARYVRGGCLDKPGECAQH